MQFSSKINFNLKALHSKLVPRVPFKIRDSALCLEVLIVKVKMVEYKTHLITDICHCCYYHLEVSRLSSLTGKKPGQSMPK